MKVPTVECFSKCDLGTMWKPGELTKNEDPWTEPATLGHGLERQSLESPQTESESWGAKVKASAF